MPVTPTTSARFDELVDMAKPFCVCSPLINDSQKCSLC